MDDTAFFDDLPDASDYEDFWDDDEYPRDTATRLAINGPHGRKGIQHATTTITDLNPRTGPLNQTGGVRPSEVLEAGDCGIF